MRSLTLQSTDKNDSLHIERRELDQLVNYDITASFLGEQVTSEGVAFLGTTAFVRSLTALETSRAESAVLGGTEGCKLVFQINAQMGHIWLTFRVARKLHTFNSQAWMSRYGRVELSGGFPVSGECIGQLVHGFTELFQLETRAA